MTQPSARFDRRVTRRHLLLRAAALGLALPSASLLAACGQQSTPAPKPTESKPSVNAPTTAPAPSPAAAASPSPGASPAAQAAPKTTGPATELVMGATTNIQTIAGVVGVEKGIYLKHNIDLKVRSFNSGAESIKAAQVNEAQFATPAFGSLSSARAQDIKIKAVILLVSDAFEPMPDKQVAIVATANSGITKPEDLVGKKIATTTGVAPDFYLKAVLAKAGISENRVELINVQPPNMVASLQTGVDAAAASEPYPELFLSRLPGSRLVSRGGGYIAQRPVMASMEEWIAANRLLLERFSGATAETTQFIRKNPDEAAEIASRWLSGIETPILRKAIGHLTLDPRMSPAVRTGWEAEVGGLVQRGTLKQMITFEEGVDVALIESVAQRYPQFFDDLKPL